MPARPVSVLWIAPERKGGIRSYVDGLLPYFGPALRVAFEMPTPVELAKDESSIVHVQHEYGLFGSKIPGRYFFPRWFREARRAAPGKKWVATAHSVLAPDYRFPYPGRGLQKIPRFLLNAVLSLPKNPVADLWGRKTWRGFDGAIVLHRQQIEPVRAAGCPRVVVIPLPVPRIEGLRPVAPERRTKVTVFGFFTIDKGQDVAIRAWKILGPSAPKLVLAGGVRRAEDQAYYDSCVRMIEELGLRDRVEITGYVPDEKLEDIYAESRLVLAPFRASTGSASIATAFAYRAAVMASDLELNREQESRAPGCIAFFKSGSSEDLARKIRELLADENRLEDLRAAGGRYAEEFSSDRIADLHRAFYREVLDGSRP